MRAGGACTVQQTLTTEAASVLKHSLTLARRRGHAQVTPLHVAATLLSTRTSLLRRACLKSQQSHHPLHGRALELCFNVALNRLPTATAPSGPTPLSLPLLHGHSQPSLSNALIAALKRAQAHQRRGCIEQQNHQPQQPLSLTIKVELEQLILSILDDPSVSRVMREAGFSSTDIKNNLEEYSSSASSSTSLFYSTSGGVFSSPCSPKREIIINPSTNTYWQNSAHFLNHSFEQSPVFLSPQKIRSYPVCKSDDSDMKVVLEVLLKKRKNIVVVGDFVSLTEGLVTDLMGKVEKGEVPEELKSVQFIKFQFASVSLRFMRKQDVEMNLSDLKRKVDFSLSSGGGRGVIIYAGDLRWAVETNDRDSFTGYDNLVDYLVGEMKKLLSGYNNSSSKVWLMATASYQTYMNCQMKQPPLEAQWGLHAISVPSGGLGLSLHGPSVHVSKTLSQIPSQMMESKPFNTKEEQNTLSCCAECTNNYEKEAAFLKLHQNKALPSWLQTHSADDHQQDELGELRRKWNRLCSSLHHVKPTPNYLGSFAYKNSQNSIGKNYNSSYPWWHTQKSINLESNTVSFPSSTHSPDHKSNHIPRFRRQHSCIEVFGYGVSKREEVEARLESLKNSEGKEVKITLALGNCLLSDSEKIEEEKIRETVLDRGDISKVLEENVPWESKTMPLIVDALIQSTARKNSRVLIEGKDFVGKRRLAMAVAEAIFGSTDFLLTMSMRKMGNCGIPCSEILEEAMTKRKKLVVLIEDMDLADIQFINFLSNGFETGYFGRSSVEQDESSVQAIFILTRGSSNGGGMKADQNSVIQLQLLANDTKTSNPVTPNSMTKRKGEWDFSNKAKNARLDNEEDASNVDNGRGKKVFSRQSSLNTLDLNMKADEDEDNDSSSVEFSPVQGELTCESKSSPDGFLKLIENRFVFDQDPSQDRGFKEDFSSKMRGCFQQVIGGEHMDSFSVEHRVLEEMVVGSGYFLNSLFEKWLKDVFQKTMQAVNNSGKGKGILQGVRLCLKGKGDSNSGLWGEGYIGTNLPQKIHVSFLD